MLGNFVRFEKEPPEFSIKKGVLENFAKFTRKYPRPATFRGWGRRADLSSAYQFWGHLIWAPKFKKGRKIKTLFSKLNIESEHISSLNGTKTIIVLLTLLRFCQYLGKKVGGSCAQVSKKQLDQLERHRGHASKSTWHNSTDTQIRVLDHPLTLLKKRLRHKCFRVNFAKFFSFTANHRVTT